MTTTGYIITIVAIVLSPFLGRMFTLLIPDKKTLIKILWIISTLILGFCVPIYFIIQSIMYDAFDKFFVLKIAFFVGAIFYQIIMLSIGRIITHITNIQSKTIDSMEGLHALISDIVNKFNRKEE